MKKIYKILLLPVFMATLLISCEDGFLDRAPLDATSDETFFTSASDLKNYMNGRYGEILRRNGQRWAPLTNGSDNWVHLTPHNSLMQHEAAGNAPQTSGFWNGRYDYIRQINYFLENSVKVPEDAQSKHYVGEGYFARAWAYFRLLQNYGGVPYIDKVLNLNDEELYSVRESRDFIANKIIEDLDKAIENLDWKGQGEAGAQRINKQTALTLKTRVGLYEGSWEYYHGRKSTPFAVAGQDGTSFLNMAVDAGNMLIAHEGSNVFVGTADFEYQDLFRQSDYSSTPGAYLYFGYSRSDEFDITQNYFDDIYKGSDGGTSKSVIDSYLMRDGKPTEISSMSLDELSMESYSINKDPRLRQTHHTPDRGPYYKFFDPETESQLYFGRFAGVNNQQQNRIAGVSGLWVWKGGSFDGDEWRNGGVDDLIMRYGEALLNFAEAKAIMGTIGQSDLDKSINVLRDRVNMPQMQLADVNSWGVTYTERNGYDPSAPNIVNEIRRERRVELLLEGFRKDDIKRWALMAEVFNGYIPLGAPAQELADYWNNVTGLLESDGWSTADLPNLVMALGSDYDTDPTGNFINPYFNNGDFGPGGRGYFVEPGRDYLSGIPKDEIDLYQDKGGVTLEQNPGWF